MDADEYIKEFGEPEEATDGREALNLSIPAEVKRKLEMMKRETGKSISQIVSEFVSEK